MAAPKKVVAQVLEPAEGEVKEEEPQIVIKEFFDA